MKQKWKLKRNRAQCAKCKDIVESKYRWDFQMCSCGSIAVDGGLDYARRVGEPGLLIDLSEWETKE